jgi:hypothetical protein
MYMYSVVALASKQNYYGKILQTTNWLENRNPLKKNIHNIYVRENIAGAEVTYIKLNMVSNFSAINKKIRLKMCWCLRINDWKSQN